MTDAKQNNKTILVSLDALLDTRLGTLLKIDPDFAFNVTSKPDYYKRETDLFEDEKLGILSKELFLKVKNNFPNEVVENSLKTNIYPFIFELCNTVVIRTINTPHASNASITINIHPYELSKLEVSIIVRAVYVLLNEQFLVTATNMSPQQLTCEHVKENYNALIMYDYVDWLNLHNRKLQTKILKDTILYVPRLSFIRSLSDDEKKLFSNNSSDPFELMTMLVCEFISLQFLPINLFCANTPQNNIMSQ